MQGDREMTVLGFDEGKRKELELFFDIWKVTILVFPNIFHPEFKNMCACTQNISSNDFSRTLCFFVFDLYMVPLYRRKLFPLTLPRFLWSLKQN